MVFLPHAKTVILLEPYCGTITEPGLSMLSCRIPVPARIKGFSVPYRALSRVNMKKHCARASRFCFFLSDWKCINCNSICPVFLRTSMRWRFSLLIGLDWDAKLRVYFLTRVSYEISGQRTSQLLSRADSTVRFFLMTLLCIRFIPFAK